MEQIFISVASYGSYDERDQQIVYAGTDYAQAERMLLDFAFPNPSNNYGRESVYQH